MNKKSILENYINKNIDALYRFAYTYMKNEDDACDVVNESVVKALKAVSSLRSEDNVKCWLYKIISNTAFTYLGKNKKVIYLDDEMQERLYTNDDYSSMNFEELVKNLPLKYKSIIVLRFLEDMSIKDIAHILDLNENTVKTRLYKALNMLKIELEGDYETQRY